MFAPELAETPMMGMLIPDDKMDAFAGVIEKYRTMGLVVKITQENPDCEMSKCIICNDDECEDKCEICGECVCGNDKCCEWLNGESGYLCNPCYFKKYTCSECGAHPDHACEKSCQCASCEETKSEDEKCYHCNATAGLVWTEGYGGVHVCGFCKTIEDNACGECDRQNDGTFKTGEDGFLRCPDCEHD